MAPNSESSETNDVETHLIEKPQQPPKIVWWNVALLLYLHLSAIYGLYLAFSLRLWKTLLFCSSYGVFFGGIGISAGFHRLWCHRTYKAKWPLRALLCAFGSISGQNDIYVWCRDHRVHHKYTETDADPHNIKRGFFFAHMGWLMCKKHPDVTAKGKNVDLSDLLADPIVRFHRRYYYPMVALFCYLIPTVIPVWFWGESYWNAYFLAAMFRYCFSLHLTWLVNSAAHRYGNQPFDRNIEARENPFIAFIANGEGWHNYHHAFPWDYSTSELGYTFNLSKRFIDLMGLIGLAYDMKTAHPDLIKQRKLKMGDGSRLAREDIEEYALKFQKDV